MTPEVRAALRRIDQQFDAIRAMPAPIPPNQRHRQGVEDVGKGGYLRVAGQIWRVEEVSHYREKRSRWYELELFGLEDGAATTIEWEKDDEVEISFNGPRRSLRELGVSADRVEAMSDAEEGTIRFEGREYRYDDDYAASFHRGGSEDGENVYFYDFETPDERHCLTVEEWGDEGAGYEYEAYVSEFLDPDLVEVIVLGGA